MNVLVSCEKVTIDDKKEGKVIINIISSKYQHTLYIIRNV